MYINNTHCTIHYNYDLLLNVAMIIYEEIENLQLISWQVHVHVCKQN